MQINEVSAVLITHNSAATINQCLDALNAFDEVVVCDTGSTDDTIARAGAYKNVRVFEIEFAGFGAAKHAAVSKATCNWILSIDSDEILDAELAAALASWDTAGDRQRLGVIDRRNFFIGRHIRHGGLGRDHIPRLFHRETHRFSTASVHEGIVIHQHSKKVQLAGGIDHFTIPDINSRINKMRDYSELAAPTARVFHPLVVMLRVIYTFAKSYFLQIGFMAGWRGLVIAWCSASGVFFKYMKAYAIQKLKQEELKRWNRHKKQYLKQVFRRGSEISTHKSWRQVMVWARAHHCAELMSFFEAPEAWMARGEIIKDGRSTTVVRVNIGGRGVIIKRSNPKTFFRKVRHCFKVSGAHINWRNAHFLKISDIATPAPVAFVEKRWGPLRLGWYYVCAYSPAPTAAEKYKHTAPTQSEQQWFAELLAKMRRARIYHGDFNAHNVLVAADGVEIIDLERMQDCARLPWAVFRYKHNKDQRRFLHDWRNNPEQLEHFSEAFSAGDETSTHI